VTKIEDEWSARVGLAVAAIVRNILADQTIDVSPDLDLRADLGLDSADVAELLVELAVRLGVDLPDTVFEPTDDGDPLSTVGTLTDAVVRAIGVTS
jgi:acyl carrier protein